MTKKHGCLRSKNFVISFSRSHSFQSIIISCMFCFPFESVNSALIIFKGFSKQIALANISHVLSQRVVTSSFGFTNFILKLSHKFFNFPNFIGEYFKVERIFLTFFIRSFWGSRKACTAKFKTFAKHGNDCFLKRQYLGFHLKP